jgi:hypothetical protein
VPETVVKEKLSATWSSSEFLLFTEFIAFWLRKFLARTSSRCPVDIFYLP